MSLRMAILVLGGHLIAKPRLRRTSSPEKTARKFERTARLIFRGPAFTRHLVRGTAALPLHWISVGRPADRRIILFLHGGAFFVGSGRSYRGLLARLSLLTGVEVCAPDYRLYPQATFPAPVDDAIAAWEGLIAAGYDPGQIVLGGDSAGGCLAFALLSHVLQRDQRPAGIFAMSPWTDLTLSGESLVTNAACDPVLPVERMSEAVALYLAGADPADPRASPLFARYPDPPPAFIQVGTEEALLDDALRIADALRAAGGDVTLQTWPRAPHVWHLFDGWIPEARAAMRAIAGFVQTSLDKANR
jgi:acetyl esterase/lipase